MPSYNHVCLIGHLTRDPELRYVPSGAAVASCCVAVNHVWTSQDGQKNEEVAFVDFDCWNKTAENLAQYMKKGGAVLVDGRIKQESWEDKNGGGKRSKLKVVAERIVFLGGKEGGNGEQPQAQGARPPQRGSRPPARSQSRAEAAQPDGGESGYQPDAQEADVPF